MIPEIQENLAEERESLVAIGISSGRSAQDDDGFRRPTCPVRLGGLGKIGGVAGLGHQPLPR
jgi:hypothetical protein